MREKQSKFVQRKPLHALVTSRMQIKWFLVMCGGVQPWMTADEIQEAIQTAIATNTGPDGQPATVQSVYLRHIREVKPETCNEMHKGHHLPRSLHPHVHQHFTECLHCASIFSFMSQSIGLMISREDPLLAYFAGAGSVSPPNRWCKASKPGAALP